MAVSNRGIKVFAQPGRGSFWGAVKGVVLSLWSHWAKGWYRMSDPKPDMASHSAVQHVKFPPGRAWLGGVSVFDNSLTLAWHHTSAKLWWYNLEWSQLDLLWTLLWSVFEGCGATLAFETFFLHWYPGTMVGGLNTVSRKWRCFQVVGLYLSFHTENVNPFNLWFITLMV